MTHKRKSPKKGGERAFPEIAGRSNLSISIMNELEVKGAWAPDASQTLREASPQPFSPSLFISEPGFHLH